MLGRKAQNPEDETTDAKWFDDYEVTLGDTMRGERATMGKSLLDVQRELRIKATYIDAIENSDPSVFETQGFIAGYVRSYARYLGMDPDFAFRTFCAESGFQLAHGMSEEASRPLHVPQKAAPAERRHGEFDPLLMPGTPLKDSGDGFMSRVDPGAIGSSLVLLLLIGAIGFGGFTVFNEIQRVQVAPVEEAPRAMAELDPLDRVQSSTEDADVAGPSADALSRLYRPQALDVPVLVPRDSPIAAIDPETVGNFTQTMDPQPLAVASVEELMGATPTPTPQVIEAPSPTIQMVAVRPAWVRVKTADGTTIFEGIMEGGETYDIPETDLPPVLRVGDSGSIYFAMNGQHFGPIGARGTVTSNVALSREAIGETMTAADLQDDADLARVVAELSPETIDTP